MSELVGDVMNRLTVHVGVVASMTLIGLMLAFTLNGKHDNHDKLPHILAAPLPPPNEVFYIDPWTKTHLKLNTPTVIDHMEVHTIPPEGNVAWETTVTRTATHLIITYVCQSAGGILQQEHTVPLTDLTMDFPNKKISGTLDGRFEYSLVTRSSSPDMTK